LQAAQFLTKIYRNVILPLVLNPCKLLYLTLREEHKLRLCENKVQKRTFGIRKLKWRIEIISEQGHSNIKIYQRDKIKDDVEKERRYNIYIYI
jgi:hypothetical protein